MRRSSYVSCMHCHGDLTKKGVKRKRCAGCHSVFYDDVTCQKKDWAIHKTECKELQSQFIIVVRFQFSEVDTMAKLLARPDACGTIAEHYYKGLGGFEQNYGLAVFWLLQWMKGGCASAMYMLGMAYTDGVVPNKCKEGVKLLRRACKEKDCTAIMVQNAQYKIGRCFSSKGDEDCLLWFRKAAEQGHALAQVRLGQGLIQKLRQSGESIRADTVGAMEAVKWYRRSAEQGNADAEYGLGDCFLHGLGVAKDPTEAVVWYRKSADQGDAGAQFQIGVLLMRKLQQSGESIRADTVDAMEMMKWYRRAAEQGCERAEYALGGCLLNGEGVAKDPTEAVVWLRKSADQGNAASQYHLGVCYAGGFGVVLDLDEARRWFRLAADQGMEEAKAALRDRIIWG